VGFRRIWRGRQGFWLDPIETGSGSFGVGTDGLVIGVGFGVSRLFRCFWVGNCDGFRCFWVVSVFMGFSVFDLGYGVLKFIID
jgi:hypothetical protein